VEPGSLTLPGTEHVNFKSYCESYCVDVLRDRFSRVVGGLLVAFTAVRASHFCSLMATVRARHRPFLNRLFSKQFPFYVLGSGNTENSGNVSDNLLIVKEFLRSQESEKRSHSYPAAGTNRGGCSTSWEVEQFWLQQSRPGPIKLNK